MRYEKVYGINESRTSYKGISLKEGFEDYLISRVKNRFFDIEGTTELLNEFQKITSTGFEYNLLVDIFRFNPPIESWKIGESLAECYLEDFEGVKFYYHSGRDAKNPKANLQGADLVGFIEANDEIVFLFGEVKTSSDPSSPPKVLYGRSGMIQQLERIKKDPKLRGTIIRWLGFKVKNLSSTTPFRKYYEKALKLYIKEGTEKFHLIGILVRDTQPRESDLKQRYESLKNRLYEKVYLHLIALYLPISIEQMKKYFLNKAGNK